MRTSVGTDFRKNVWRKINTFCLKQRKINPNQQETREKLIRHWERLANFTTDRVRLYFVRIIVDYSCYCD